MAIQVNPELLREVKRYGAFDISACFNCGNCTAVCPLSSAEGSFPRKMIRYGQLGMREKLLSGPEPWLCYYCGECSETCPRQAEPGEYMASLRRYAIASCEPTGLAALMYTRPWAALAVTLLLAVLLGAFMVTMKPGGHLYPAWLFPLVPYEVIHTVGMAVSALFFILAALGIGRFIRRFTRGGLGKNPARALVRTLREIVTMKRHRPAGDDAPWHRAPWFLHMTIMWGFLGLFAATLLDFLFIYFLGWTIFWPARLLGTLAGLAMLYGVAMALARRAQKKEKNAALSRLADWWLLAVLLLLAVTGFWIELVVTVRASGTLHDAVLLLHTAMAMELVLLTALTKLAHAVYRPLALFFHYLGKENT